LYFGKGKFGGKKFTLQKSEFYFAKEFFPFKNPAKKVFLMSFRSRADFFNNFFTQTLNSILADME
jgi:hypothetical protein